MAKYSKPTFASIQKDVMARARKAGLDEGNAEALLRRELKKHGIPTPDSMRKTQNYEDYFKGDPVGKAKGGMAKKNYNKGGYANCGASVPPAQGKK